MSESTWLVAALWVSLALLASLISIRTAISVALLLLDRMFCEVEQCARGRDGF